MSHAVRAIVALAFAAAAVCAPTSALADTRVVIPFQLTYSIQMSETTFANFSCAGTRTVDGRSIQGRETCQISGAIDGFVPGTYVGRPAVVVPPFGLSAWASDFDGLVAQRYVNRIVLNGDGTLTQSTIAFYS